MSGAGDHLGFALAHRWTERRLQRSPLAWTILRNGLYAELVGALAAPIDGIMSAPFGVAPIAAVAREDLADAALSVLRAPHHHISAIYDLSGTTAWSVPELAHALDVAYAPVSLAQQRAILAASGMLPFQPAMLMSIYSAAAGGFLAAPASDLDSLLSTAPRDSFALAMAAAKPR